VIPAVRDPTAGSTAALSAWLAHHFPAMAARGEVAPGLPPDERHCDGPVLTLGFGVVKARSERVWRRKVAGDFTRLYEQLFAGGEAAYLHAVRQSPSDRDYDDEERPIWHRPEPLDLEPERRELRACLGEEIAAGAEWWYGANLLGSYRELWTDPDHEPPPDWDVDAAAVTVALPGAFDHRRLIAAQVNADEPDFTPRLRFDRLYVINLDRGIIFGLDDDQSIVVCAAGADPLREFLRRNGERVYAGDEERRRIEEQFGFWPVQTITTEYGYRFAQLAERLVHGPGSSPVEGPARLFIWSVADPGNGGDPLWLAKAYARDASGSFSGRIEASQRIDDVLAWINGQLHELGEAGWDDVEPFTAVELRHALGLLPDGLPPRPGSLRRVLSRLRDRT
jgi:hypothetical protein